HGVCACCILGAYLAASPPRLLTVYPPVYHDDYTLMAASASLLRGEGLSLPPYNSTAPLEEAFQGRGSLTPGLSAGYSVAQAIWLKALGLGIFQGRLFVWTMGAALLLLTYALGARWWNQWVGLTASLLVMFDASYWYSARAVRPETWTVSAYLLAALLLSARSERVRRRVPEAAGALLGIGMCGHPIGALLAPVVASVPFFVSGRLPERRFLLRFVIPLALVVSSYAAYLGLHWDDVRTNLAVHARHRSLGEKALSEKISFEWERYHTGYLNSYQLGRGNRVRAYAFIGAAVLLATGVVAASRRPREHHWKAAVLFGGGVAVSLLGMAVLAADNNFPYLVNILPWLYLSGCAGVCCVARVIAGSRLRVLQRVVYVCAFIVPAEAAHTGIVCYQGDIAPYRAAGVVGYDRIEELIAQRLEKGSFVIGMETAWLAAERADAQFVYSDVLDQWLPAYKRYPVRAVHDGSHVVEYSFDIELLRELDRAGTTVYCVSDMWDWGWNAYYPHGEYARSYVQFREQLDRHFAPELMIFSRDRGLITLHRFVGEEGVTAGDGPIVYIESQPYRMEKQIAAESAGLRHGEIQLPA
ncbi:MAG: hypothetical protein ACREIV_06035, partial [Planctomycetaceae bacterium]